MHARLEVLQCGFGETDFDENLLEIYIILKTYSLDETELSNYQINR